MMGYVDGEEEKMMTFNKQNQEDENRNSSLNAIDLNDDDKGGRVKKYYFFSSLLLLLKILKNSEFYLLDLEFQTITIQSF